MRTPEPLWDQLRQVRSWSFVAHSTGQVGWHGSGVGTVEVRLPGDGVMTSSERGTWRPEGGRDLPVSNAYRWTLADDKLRLEHLRFGINHLVHLFDLVQVDDEEWWSASPHLCREDCYAAVLTVSDDCIVLRWSIDGPKKKETIEYTYSC